jgi:hypothetical protein
MYQVKKSTTVKTFQIIDDFSKKRYNVTWNNYTANPWFVEDEYGEEIDQETMLGEDLIGEAQDMFDDWCEDENDIPNTNHGVDGL